ncbi:MAG: ribosomal protein S18-alanine N-acetyltransferase [Candidatus Helarchaeota archaeon]|nr:ribosomal protein S18-alanine N-acetyltransferase [Candidatus Helarchaeota archaeon]
MSNKTGTPTETEKCNYDIRVATQKDLDRIYQIEVLSFREAYPKTLLWQLIKDKTAICLIIEDNQKILGFAVGIMRSGEKGHIISIAIDPKFRNFTLGSLVLTNLISMLKKRGASILELEVRISNKVAQKLYKKFNFQIKEIKQRYYSNGEDAYLMVCKLDE